MELIKTIFLNQLKLSLVNQRLNGLKILSFIKDITVSIIKGANASNVKKTICFKQH